MKAFIACRARTFPLQLTVSNQVTLAPLLAGEMATALAMTAIRRCQAPGTSARLDTSAPLEAQTPCNARLERSTLHMDEARTPAAANRALRGSRALTPPQCRRLCPALRHFIVLRVSLAVHCRASLGTTVTEGTPVLSPVQRVRSRRPQVRPLATLARLVHTVEMPPFRRPCARRAASARKAPDLAGSSCAPTALTATPQASLHFRSVPSAMVVATASPLASPARLGFVMLGTTAPMVVPRAHPQHLSMAGDLASRASLLVMFVPKDTTAKLAWLLPLHAPSVRFLHREATQPYLIVRTAPLGSSAPTRGQSRPLLLALPVSSALQGHLSQ